MLYRDFPIEQARPLFEQLKTVPPKKDTVPKIGGRRKIRIPFSENK